MKMNAYKCHLYSVLLVSFSIGMIEDKCETPQYLAAGDKGIIACSFQEGFHTVLWYNSAYLAEGKSLLQIIDGVKGGTGYYSGEYDICGNGSLIISNVTLKHEHNFTVFLLKSQDDDPVSLEVKAIVTVTAVPVVDGCNEQSYCVLEVETEGTLKCLLRGIRPKVLLEWKTFLDRDENLISFTNQQFDVNSNGNVYDVMLTSAYQIKNKTKNRITMICRTSGSNIQILQSTTQFDILFDNGQTTIEPLAPVRSFPLWILAIVLPLSLLALFSCLFFIQRGRRRSQKRKREENEKEENLSMLSSTVKESQTVLSSPDDTESSQDHNSERVKKDDSASPVNSTKLNIPVATPPDGIETSTLKDGNPSVLLIKAKQKFSDPSNRIQKYEIRNGDVAYLGEKVILLVGETGTGKTRMINTMANYLLGNKWDDKYRYQLLSDEEESDSGASQVQSRTQWITSYTLYVQNKWRHNFTLIDSPGFGDSRGRERDQTLTEQMRVFFTSKGNSGIDHIDCVALVVNATMKRLTVNQKYIFDSVLNLFGKDISDNIFLLCTHATNDELEHGNPDVAKTVKEHKISYKQHFLFNNEFLYYQKKKGSKLGSEHPSKVWTVGEQTLGKFIDNIFKCIPKSLSLTSKVLQERKNLELTVQTLHNLIKSTITKMNEAQKEMKTFEKHKDKMETHHNFKYTVEVEKGVREELSNGEKATNCTYCKRTCHYPCGDEYFMSIGSVYMCAVMNYLAVFRGCSVCTQKCDVSKHVLESYRYKTIITTETRTKEDMKRKYEDAQSSMQCKETIIQKITKEINLAQERVNDTIENLRKCLGRLDEIALKCKSTSVLELLEGLKKQEIQAMEPGYEDRVKELDKLCETERKTMLGSLCE